ncbi:CPBP family intramembrane glutamic endopeptidase [Nonomuraea ferruginea]|uniref:CPBP family intramembrane metalloprotease n=2 Tax=Nonomuraea ferruginea TaxID=46174 RepID=A0ABT4SVZ7_9ACTN|nr:CPBP family intramembrane glutamic endopeptidase [Nonomuraea ferruginea]MDA0641431.1 CPBP family intramembrane metalloprotease [Nonomuraea ferruginea]
MEMQDNPEPSPGPYGGPPAGYYPYPPARPSWYAPVPHDARYDQLARTPVSRVWRQVVGTLAVAAAFFVIGAIVLLAGVIIGAVLGIPQPERPEQISGDPVYGMILLLLSIAAVLPVVFGVAALVQRRRPGTLSSVAGRVRWSWLLICVGAAVLSMVLAQIAQVVLLVATGERTEGIFGWTGWERFLPALVVIVLLVPFQAATEEYLFRGWLLQAFGAHLRNPWWGIVISSVLFASLHGYQWAGLLDVFAFGLAMAVLTVWTGGLEAAIALHVLNNTVAFGISAAAGQLDQALDQASVPVPWQSLVGTVVQLGVFILLVLYFAKKRSISTTSG